MPTLDRARSPRALRLALVLTAVAALLVAPTVDASSAPPASTTAELSVEVLADGTSEVIALDDVVSVTAELDDRALELRAREDGAWSDWQAVTTSAEHAPDLGTAEAAVARGDVSEPVWLGDADAIQLRADAAGEVRLSTVTMAGDRSYRADATPPATAEAGTIWPPIVPRERWDPAGECQPASEVEYGPTPKRIFVHHTYIFPHYDADEGDDLVRAVCLGHVTHRGFSDVGYNFLVDQYGVIYQGREGGILRSVVGAHAQGFNEGSIGIAVVGDFQSNKVPPAAIEALDTLAAWLSDLHGIDPEEVSAHTSTGGDSTRFEEGTEVMLPGVVGHRDTGLDTACPGDHLYDLVRGTHSMAERVHHRLETDYGWDDHDHAHDHAVIQPAPALDAAAAAPTDEHREHAGAAVKRVVETLSRAPIERAVQRLVTSGMLGLLPER